MNVYNYESLRLIAQTEEGQCFIANLKKAYQEKYENIPIPPLKYEYFKEYYISGDRVKYQQLYFERRKRLMLLQVLALLEDKYLEELEQTLATICDEFTWVLPAHCYNVNNDNKFDYTTIDLFAAETGAYLAETAYVFKDKLTFDILDRIKISVRNKIVENYEKRTFHFDKEWSHNWAAVCAGSIGIAYLYLFPERFPLVRERVFNTMENYLGSLDKDGYCTEGYSYWVYGFGFFSWFMDTYQRIIEERPSILDKQIVKNTIKYGKDCILDGNIYLPFADGGSKGEHDEIPLLCIMEELFDETLFLPELYEQTESSEALGFHILYALNKNRDDFAIRQGTVYYQTSQVFLFKNKHYAFAVKGGCNAEIHNHNDIGTFSIVKGQKQLIADLGVGEYTKNYFTLPDDSENGRYGEKIFVCSSFAHSVPIVNGQPQKYGAEYRGKVLSQDKNYILIDLAKAYQIPIEKLTACYKTEENVVRICYEYQENANITFRFISQIQPKIDNGRLFVDDMEIKNSERLIPIITSVPYSKYLGESGIAYVIDYMAGRNTQKMDFEFTL